MPLAIYRRITAVLLLAVSCSLSAHHSASVYDLERLITIRGTLTSVLWANPHVELQIAGQNESGDLVDIVIETSWPSSLIRNGLTQDSFVKGEFVVIEGHPSREAGRITAWGRSLVRPDGTVLRLPPKADFVPF